MKILAIETEIPGAQPDKIRMLLASEALKVWELYQKGIIREAYFHAERHVAVLVMECDDLQAARSVIALLPLVESGLIRFDLIPLAPYDGFSRLFGPAFIRPVPLG